MAVVNTYLKCTRKADRRVACFNSNYIIVRQLRSRQKTATLSDWAHYRKLFSSIAATPRLRNAAQIPSVMRQWRQRSLYADQSLGRFSWPLNKPMLEYVSSYFGCVILPCTDEQDYSLRRKVQQIHSRNELLKVGLHKKFAKMQFLLSNLYIAGLLA
jgi:hypothetical protein